jgi:hypothetical protein
MENNIPKDAFLIVEEKDGKSHWTKVGKAFVNKDGSINVFLDAFPRDGKVQIRDRMTKNQKEKKEE